MNSDLSNSSPLLLGGGSDQRSATFAAEGHPLRPPPDFGLEVRVEGEQISIANTGLVRVTVLFEGERCQPQRR